VPCTAIHETIPDRTPSDPLRGASPSVGAEYSWGLADVVMPPTAVLDEIVRLQEVLKRKEKAKSPAPTEQYPEPQALRYHAEPVLNLPGREHFPAFKTVTTPPIPASKGLLGIAMATSGIDPSCFPRTIHFLTELEAKYPDEGWDFPSYGKSLVRVWGLVRIHDLVEAGGADGKNGRYLHSIFEGGMDLGTTNVIWTEAFTSVPRIVGTPAESRTFY